MTWLCFVLDDVNDHGSPAKTHLCHRQCLKLSEVRAILAGVAELESVALDLLEIQGTAEEIAKDKYHRAAEVVSISNIPNGHNTLQRTADRK